MNFDLTEDQREIKRTAREFLASRYTMEKVRSIALDGAADPHWDEIVELGWPDVAELGTVELAVVAEELDHHPDIDIRWRTLTFACSTHSEGGLTAADFELAGKIEALA